MHESQFISAVNKLLPPTVYKWKIHDTYTGGIPDTYYSGDKTDLWVEYKLLRNVPKKHTPNLSPLQIKWLREQYNRGRNVAVVIGVQGGKCLLLQDLQWEGQVDVTNLISKKDLASWITKIIM